MSVRNLSYLPIMGEEGYFDPQFETPYIPKNAKIWHAALKPHERLYHHQTLNSVRKNIRFHQYPNRIPVDSLDFILEARYNHTMENFPNKTDYTLQKETIGIKTFRLLKNRRILEEKKIEKMGHPLLIGGTIEKISPHSVKLINSGHHTQLTNKGYSRQPADGNFFHY